MVPHFLRLASNLFRTTSMYYSLWRVISLKRTVRRGSPTSYSSSGDAMHCTALHDWIGLGSDENHETAALETFASTPTKQSSPKYEKRMLRYTARMNTTPNRETGVGTAWQKSDKYVNPAHLRGIAESVGACVPAAGFV